MEELKVSQNQAAKFRSELGYKKSKYAWKPSSNTDWSTEKTIWDIIKIFKKNCQQ